MALPTKKTLTRGKVSVRNENFERVLVDESDEELAFRQSLHDAYIENYVPNKINDLNNMIYDVHKSFDWTQLVDTTLTKDSQKEFTDYQVNQKRYNNKTITQREIRFDNVAKSIQKNEDRIHLMKKSLPEEIRKTIGHIEFAKPLDKK